MNVHPMSPALNAACAMQQVRAQGRIAIRFKRRANATVISDLAEAGGYRAKFPPCEAGCEAVIINTGGGMTGGDALTCTLSTEPGAAAIVTTQSAEKLYRSSGLDASIHVQTTVEDNSTLAWLPQETILFSGARICREISCNVGERGALLIAETLVFGRIAQGEKLGDGLLRDSWRIRRGGKLIFADEMRFAGNLDVLLKRPATLSGLRAMSTIFAMSPHAESQCEAVREAMQGFCPASGASAWNGMLLARAADENPARLRAWVMRVLSVLHGHALPRVWQC